jgi:hypothetical protein
MMKDSEPLGAVKDWLRGQVHKGGARCPCCTQFAKVYKRQINSGMARSLIRMYRVAGLDWVHIPTALPARSREEGKLAYWGLVEEASEPREDGGRAGWWRITSKGEAFLRRQLKVPKYALVYDARRLGFDETEMVDIQDCLGARFNLTELMEK